MLAMPTIRIRDVPDALHERLKARAASVGLSLPALLLCEFAALAERPTMDELRARLEALDPIAGDPTPAQAVRTQRGRLDAG
jgi:plasmid stability protein